MIYKLIDDLREELSQKQHPVQVEHMVGRGTVIEQFLINIKKKKVAVAGCKVSHLYFLFLVSVAFIHKKNLCDPCIAVGKPGSV